ncbi:hypothetical protein FMEAI12_6540001 [Parafrankia sp. Ea1.12]|nr:hypothetical protein FMEAI12_6540001 [Parafrankia sp. Ea1.12]
MSVSRVRENLMHGSTGGGWKRGIVKAGRDEKRAGKPHGHKYRTTIPTATMQPRQPPTLHTVFFQRIYGFFVVEPVGLTVCRRPTGCCAARVSRPPAAAWFPPGR